MSDFNLDSLDNLSIDQLNGLKEYIQNKVDTKSKDINKHFKNNKEFANLRKLQNKLNENENGYQLDVDKITFKVSFDLTMNINMGDIDNLEKWNDPHRAFYDLDCHNISWHSDTPSDIRDYIEEALFNKCLEDTDIKDTTTIKLIENQLDAAKQKKGPLKDFYTKLNSALSKVNKNLKVPLTHDDFNEWANELNSK